MSGEVEELRASSQENEADAAEHNAGADSEQLQEQQALLRLLDVR
jgi:hypothetical protein